MNEELTAVRQTLQQPTNHSNHQWDTEQRLLCVSAGHLEKILHKVAEVSNLCRQTFTALKKTQTVQEMELINLSEFVYISTNKDKPISVFLMIIN